ncbi:MAG: transketolase, partial [Gammaproteobacteria bacterium]|nr:transketolase [Gammaproteobacteria bacterium]
MSSRKTLANAIRVLSMDAVQKANSGHPGAPMGMADIAEVLYNDFMRHNPANPEWSDRDRFVMSNGHGSMLAYSVLHLTGYEVTIEDLKNFRQLHSKTPGHPEHGYAPGIETTTGPLGQGVSNAVGMAIAERALAAEFNRDDFNIVDHFTYVFMGDGCMMEGISHEACSLAGTLGLGKLIAFWDDNGISIDGKVEGWFLDDTAKRFEAYGWHVVEVDGHDPDSIKIAIEAARAITAKPSLICCKTIIGYGSPNKAGGHACHGAPLGEDEVALARIELNWEHPAFEVPEEVYQGWDHRKAGQVQEDSWKLKFEAYRDAHPELAAEFERRIDRELPQSWEEEARAFIAELDEAAETRATRQASLAAIEAYSPLLPELFGGSADLGGSNGTEWSGFKPMRAESPDANYINYGVREFGMSAILNGIVLHGGFIPFGATFLVFSDYARNALRMAALMKIQSIFVYTHDSIGLGEDGPTHQAVEQIPSLRLMPNMQVWRPCDTVETAVSWKAAIERRDGPSCLIFSRQGLKHQSRSAQQIEAIARGGYILRDCEGTPDVIIIATGSEVELVMAAC